MSAVAESRRSETGKSSLHFVSDAAIGPGSEKADLVWSSPNPFGKTKALSLR
jgi:hypothetical protein